MLAHALLAVIAANEHADRPAPAGMIPLTCNEIRRLFTVLVVAPRRVLACPHAWSNWRRRHQHRARTSHYRRQEHSPTTAITIYGWSNRASWSPDLGAEETDVKPVQGRHVGPCAACARLDTAYARPTTRVLAPREEMIDHTGPPQHRCTARGWSRRPVGTRTDREGIA